MGGKIKRKRMTNTKTKRKTKRKKKRMGKGKRKREGERERNSEIKSDKVATKYVCEGGKCGYDHWQIQNMISVEMRREKQAKSMTTTTTKER